MEKEGKKVEEGKEEVVVDHWWWRWRKRSLKISRRWRRKRERRKGMEEEK